MRVSAKFRKELLDSTNPAKPLDERGDPPALTEPDLEPGQRITIEPGRVWITVKHRTKAKVWAYSITDFREAYMGKVGGLTTEPAHGLATRDDNGYDPPVVPARFQKQLTKEARLREAGRRNTEDEGIRAAKQFAGNLRSAVIQVARAGGNPMALMARVKRELDAEVERQVADVDKAA